LGQGCDRLLPQAVALRDERSIHGSTLGLNMLSPVEGWAVGSRVILRFAPWQASTVFLPYATRV